MAARTLDARVSAIRGSLRAGTVALGARDVVTYAWGVEVFVSRTWSVAWAAQGEARGPLAELGREVERAEAAFRQVRAADSTARLRDGLLAAGVLLRDTDDATGRKLLDRALRGPVSLTIQPAEDYE
ncbi:MAG: hypothetical protein U0324_46400 [Polyangiales bacterium]